MKCTQCGAGIVSNLCMYCGSSTSLKPAVTAPAPTSSPSQGSSSKNTSRVSVRSNSARDKINAQIAALEKMPMPENLKEQKIFILKRKLSALD